MKTNQEVDGELDGISCFFHHKMGKLTEFHHLLTALNPLDVPGQGSPCLSGEPFRPGILKVATPTRCQFYGDEIAITTVY